MQVISELDNVAFSLATLGYFGVDLQKDSNSSKNIKVKNPEVKICSGLSLRPVVLVSLLVTMISIFFGMVVWGQESHQFFRAKYPNCGMNGEKTKNMFDTINNGKCNGK